MIYIVKTADDNFRAYNNRAEADAYIATAANLGATAVILGVIDNAVIKNILAPSATNIFPEHAIVPKLPLVKRLTTEETNNLFSYGFLNSLLAEEIGLNKRA